MIIIDNFIRDPDLLYSFEDDSFWQDPGIYRWVDNPIAEPTTLEEKLISYIWQENCPLNIDLSNISGFEHWTGIFSAGDRKEIKDSDGKFYHLFKHCDKDEEEWKNSETVLNPKIGTVFYPHRENQEVLGGELKIWQTKEPDIENIPYELLLPKHNRLVLFDASYIHAVTMVTQGVRRAIAINLWESKPTTFLD